MDDVYGRAAGVGVAGKPEAFPVFDLILRKLRTYQGCGIPAWARDSATVVKLRRFAAPPSGSAALMFTSRSSTTGLFHRSA